ncbi:MAG: hypothetical protein JKY87_06640 [Mariprofundus sp.]|nr:hypothetical protein [Mariprofundus sp.]
MPDCPLFNFTDLRSDKMLDDNEIKSVPSQLCGNSRVSFDELYNLGGHKATVKRVSFFMSAFGLQLVGRMLGGLRPAGSQGYRFVNLTFGWPFLFDDEKGEYINLGEPT